MNETKNRVASGFEIDGRALEADRVDVCHVVRDGAHGGGLRLQSRHARKQCTEQRHFSSPQSWPLFLGRRK